MKSQYLIPTVESTNLCLYDSTKELSWNTRKKDKKIHQYLLQISAERVKVGDWYVVKLHDSNFLNYYYALEYCEEIKDETWVNSKSKETTRHILNCKKVEKSSCFLKEGIEMFSLDYLKEYCEIANQKITSGLLKDLGFTVKRCGISGADQSQDLDFWVYKNIVLRGNFKKQRPGVLYSQEKPDFEITNYRLLMEFIFIKKLDIFPFNFVW